MRLAPQAAAVPSVATHGLRAQGAQESGEAVGAGVRIGGWRARVGVGAAQNRGVIMRGFVGAGGAPALGKPRCWR